MDPLRLLTGVRKTDLQGTLNGVNQSIGGSWATMDKVGDAADAHRAAMERIAAAAEWAVFALAMYLAYKMWAFE